MLKVIVNISAEKGCEGKLRKVLREEPMVSGLRINECDKDILAEVNGNYEMLYSLMLR